MQWHYGGACCIQQGSVTIWRPPWSKRTFVPWEKPILGCHIYLKCMDLAWGLRLGRKRTLLPLNPPPPSPSPSLSLPPHHPLSPNCFPCSVHTAASHPLGCGTGCLPFAAVSKLRTPGCHLLQQLEST